MEKRIVSLLVLCLLAATGPTALAAKGDKAAAKGAEVKKEEEKPRLNSGNLAGLTFRGIGPAVTSGRIVDIAVDPTQPKTYYLAVASGGVWKTSNAGTTWTPVFDDQGSYSTGTVVVDPKNPLVVWVGSGENNSQRSVGYGDGVYRSGDGGRSWENVGLKESEHIGKIVIDPRDSNVVWVAAQGPLWRPGGDRGLYKTTDGGKTWKKVLEISENTGVSDLALDPRDPDTVYAVAYQRRRHVWTLINGGPESAIHKSTDGGATWRKLKAGLPTVDMGRIGIAISPINPDLIYATVEALGDAGGFFRSANRGESWEKQKGNLNTSSGQYYQELFPDPNVLDRVYAVDVFLMVTDDGGRSFRRAGETFKHVDNHAVWIDPEDSDHLLVGCDGGLYETWDRAKTWEFKPNLPITQFYRVSTDNALPFYGVYGGTQDNFSLGGPSRTISASGIVNSDWYVTLGGDGFETQVDPTDSNVVYAQLQHGNLVRFDKKSGEAIDIQPQPTAPGESLRWNWDSPLLISPHSHTRLYFGAQKLFRSDDRGNTWRAISGDLTRQIDRNQLEVMGKVWSVDTVAKNASTSLYGNIVSFSESPKAEGLLYAGTDDGLVQVSEDGGASWRKIETFPGVPERTYVTDLEASVHDADTVYATFGNHKMGDFKPYVLKSADRGRTWSSITGDLPERGNLWTLGEDHVDRDLLFVGTELGLFVTVDGGKKWLQMKGGLPTIAIRDIEIQRRENDLVLASFGRGFFILDDYSPLRQIDEAAFGQDVILFPAKNAWMYHESTPLGLPKAGFLGHSYFTAPNPPVGATLTYYLKESIQTRKEKRQEAEKKTQEAGGKVSYPTWDELRAEDREEAPTLVVTIMDEDGQVVRRFNASAKAGVTRVTWDLRYPPADPTSLEPFPADNPFASAPTGPLAAPGRYTASLAKRVEGKLEPIGTPQSFEAVPLANASLPAADRAVLLAFQRQTARLQRAVMGTLEAMDEADKRLDHLKQALVDTPAAPAALGDRARELGKRLYDLRTKMLGDRSLARRHEPTPPAIADRVGQIIYGHWSSTSAPTNTHRQLYDLAAAEFTPVLAEVRQLITVDLTQLENEAEAAGAPWTPGRVPTWQK